MPPLLIAAIVAAAAGATYKTAHGLHQQYGKDNKYNRMVRDLAKYQVDPNILYNQNYAAQRSSQGFGSEFLNYGGDAIERNLGSSISAGLQSGQGLGFINQAQGTANSAFQQMLMQDAMQKSRNQDILMNANKDVANENLRAWDYNVNIPQQLILGHFEKQRNAGPQNIAGGLTDLGGALASGYGAKIGGGGQGGADTGTTKPYSFSQQNMNQYFQNQTGGSNYGNDFQQPSNGQNQISSQDMAQIYQMIQQIYNSQNGG